MQASTAYSQETQGSLATPYNVTDKNEIERKKEIDALGTEIRKKISEINRELQNAPIIGPSSTPAEIFQYETLQRTALKKINDLSLHTKARRVDKLRAEEHRNALRDFPYAINDVLSLENLIQSHIKKAETLNAKVQQNKNEAQQRKDDIAGVNYQTRLLKKDVEDLKKQSAELDFFAVAEEESDDDFWAALDITEESADGFGISEDNDLAFWDSPKPDHEEGESGDSYFEIKREGELEGVVFKNGEIAIPFKKWRIKSYRDGMARVQTIEATVESTTCTFSGGDRGYQITTFEEGVVGQNGLWLIKREKKIVGGNFLTIPRLYLESIPDGTDMEAYEARKQRRIERENREGYECEVAVKRRFRDIISSYLAKGYVRGAGSKY